MENPQKPLMQQRVGTEGWGFEPTVRLSVQRFSRHRSGQWGADGLRQDGRRACRSGSEYRRAAWGSHGTDLVRSLALVMPSRFGSVALSRIRRTCGCPGGGPGEVPSTCRCHLPRIVDSPIFVPDRGRSRRTVGVGGLGGLAWSCRPVDEAARATWPGRKLRRPKQKQQRPT